jgi:hypothetical protein
MRLALTFFWTIFVTFQWISVVSYRLLLFTFTIISQLQYPCAWIYILGYSFRWSLWCDISMCYLENRPDHVSGSGRANRNMTFFFVGPRPCPPDGPRDDPTAQQRRTLATAPGNTLLPAAAPGRAWPCLDARRRSWTHLVYGWRPATAPGPVLAVHGCPLPTMAAHADLVMLAMIGHPP